MRLEPRRMRRKSGSPSRWRREPPCWRRRRIRLVPCIGQGAFDRFKVGPFWRTLPRHRVTPAAPDGSSAQTTLALMHQTRLGNPDIGPECSAMRDFRVAIVVGSFHAAETERMLSTAIKTVQDIGLRLHSVAKVPGAYEKPLAVKRLLLRDDVDGIVVLGIIEKGETAHGRVMGHTVSDALIRLQLEFMKPIGIGIIGPEAEPSQFAPRLEKHARAAVEAMASMLIAGADSPALPALGSRTSSGA